MIVQVWQGDVGEGSLSWHHKRATNYLYNYGCLGLCRASLFCVVNQCKFFLCSHFGWDINLCQEIRDFCILVMTGVFPVGTFPEMKYCMVLVSSTLKSFYCSAGRAAIISTSGLLLDSRDPFRLSYQLIDFAYCCSSSLSRCVDSLIILCSNKVSTTPCKLY
jgi:hypothetical protein